MKILYGLGRRPGAVEQYLRFKSNIPYQVKTIGQWKYTHELSHVDFMADIFYGGSLWIDHFQKSFLKQIEDYAPDLIISDDEIISARLASKLSIPLWRCSPNLLCRLYQSLPQINRYYRQTILPYILDRDAKFPEAQRYMVYSPLGGLDFLELPEPLEWVEPEAICSIGKTNLAALVTRAEILSDYFKYFKDWCVVTGKFSDNIINFKSGGIFFSTGETSYLADAIHNQASQIVIAPEIKNPETVLNALFFSYLGLGTDIGQIELTQKEYCYEQLDREFIKTNTLKQYTINRKQTLAEKVKQYVNML